MRRRTFLATIASAAVAPAASTVSAEAATVSDDGTIADLQFESSASLLRYDYERLTDDGVVAVWAEPTAENVDEDGNGDATDYGDDPIPLVASEGNVVGFGAVLVDDRENWQPGNEEFLLNVWDAHADGDVVYWDESHDQYYDLESVSTFADYAEGEGYDVRPATDLLDALADADAIVVTSPASAFTDEELDALSSFVDAGGAVFLHDQGDYGDYDETRALNDIAYELYAPFRFNDDQVVDRIRNWGESYQPRTDEFNADFPYFGAREGLGLDPDATYRVPVVDVADGDTATVEFDDGTTESIRILGIDTPEKSAYSQYERPEEWEGISDTDALEYWADEATDFAIDRLDGKTVDLFFDENEPVRDGFDRVLGYLRYDADGDGEPDTLYNREAVAEGYSRVYDSGFSRHDDFVEAERDARETDRNLWVESDSDTSSEIRDSPVDELFFPVTASVRTDSGGVDDSRTVVTAESTAEQVLDGGYAYDGAIPLAAIDEDERVAVVGAPIVDESYEEAEGHDVDTSTYGNFPFLTNVIDYLGPREGDVLIDGGHGQFGADFALSADDAAYYLRYLEGQGIELEGRNEFTGDALDPARAVLVTAPLEAFGDDEIDALRSFQDDGGAVVLLGSGRPDPIARDNVNDLAAALGTDLRVNADRVVDADNNVGTDEELPATTAFDESFPLFDAYTPDEYSFEIVEINEEADSPEEEYVVFENDGGETLDLTGWRVKDEAGYSYEFPDGFELGGGAEVTLYTGEGEDTEDELYWGYGIEVWNDGGDTVFVYDHGDNLAAERTYPETDDGSDDQDADVVVAEINEEADSPEEESVVFENTTDAAIDLTGWSVEDEAGYTYGFPEGFELTGGTDVTLYTGEGEDTEDELYWGYGMEVWNDGGDTVFLFDEDGDLHTEQSY